MSQIEYREGECPSCKGQLSFTLDTTLGPLRITAGHLPPSCDWYKAFPDSVSVAKAVGLVNKSSVWTGEKGSS